MVSTDRYRDPENHPPGSPDQYGGGIPPTYADGFLVEVMGVEPTTSSMRPKRSSQLSYTPKKGPLTGLLILAIIAARFTNASGSTLARGAADGDQPES